MKAEQTVEKYLCRRVKEAGGMAIKMTNCNGIPDRLILVNGGVYFVETKAVSGRLSPIQIAIQNRLKSMGYNVSVLWSVEAVNDWLCEVLPC